MTYAVTDLTDEDARPVFLFLFTQGASTYRYANTPDAYYYDSATWSAGIAVVDNFAQSSDVLKDAVTVQVPADSTLAHSLFPYPPEDKTAVTVIRTDRGETDGETVWRGTVVSSSLSDGTLSIDCEPLFSSLKRRGLRASYSRTCRHVLYGSGCGVLASSYSSTVSVTEVKGTTIAIPSLATSPGLYTGGYIQTSTGQKRAIVLQPGMYVTLSMPLVELSELMVANPSGFDVTIVQGCDHTFATCVSKFNNRLNFGGFPNRPDKNPFVKAVI